MKNVRQKLIALFISLVAALAGVFAASNLSKPKKETNAVRSMHHPEKETKAMPLPPSAPMSEAGLENNPSVIAGGGGTSQGGSLKIEGTIGQSAVGTLMTGGQFSQVGGFWQASAAAANPTPTPTATPTPTPTPPPMAIPLLIMVAADNPNEAAAIDSVTFVRGPFKTRTDVNFSSDHQTRVLLFTTSLGLTQSDVPKITVTAGGISLSVENVGVVTGVTGLDASYLVVRLPDGLPPGKLPLIVLVNGVQSSNSPTLGISPP